MKRLTEAEIRKIQETQNEANLAGLLMMYPPKAGKEEKQEETDNVQNHSDRRE